MKTEKLKIDDFGKDGEGIAHLSGKTYFVENALPGEEVLSCVKQEKKSVVFAKAQNILTKSPQRQTPICPYFFVCGGCDLQHMRYDAQLEFKREMVARTLKKVGGLDIKVLPCEPSEKVFGYRNKVAFPVAYKNGKNIIGYYKKQSREIIEIEKCEIADNFSEKLLQNLKKFVSAYPNEKIKHFVARFLDEHLLLTIVLEGKTKVDGLDFLAKSLQKDFKKVAINLNLNKDISKILSDNFKEVCGEQNIKSQIENVKFEIGSGSFLQVNTNVRNKLYSFVLENACGEICVDAFSGAGLLSALLCQKFKKVYAIEIVSAACENAKTLLHKNNITSCQVVCKNCNEYLPQILQKEKVDVLVLDPPRSGCDKLLLESILKFDIPKIIYISCSPQTLSRDLKILTSKFEVEKLKPFDMFPQTKHVECVCVLKNVNCKKNK